MVRSPHKSVVTDLIRTEVTEANLAHDKVILGYALGPLCYCELMLHLPHNDMVKKAVKESDNYFFPLAWLSFSIHGK